MILPYIIKQKLFSQLLEKSDHGVFILDDQFRYVFVNKEFSTVFGVSAENTIGKPISLFRESSLSIEAKLLIDKVLDDLLLNGTYEGQVALTIRKGYSIKANIRIYSIHAGGNIYYAGLLDQSEVFSTRTLAKQSTNYDAVTQLPYKEYFMVQLGDLLLDTINEVVIVRLNFDRFRTLKTHYSANSINEVVKEFVHRIYNLTLPDLVLFSRFSEDSFTLVFESENGICIILLVLVNFHCMVANPMF